MSTEKKSIVDLTRENPVLALVAALVIGISVTAGVITRLYADSGADKKRVIFENLELRMQRDSVIRQSRQDMVDCHNRYSEKVDELNEEIIALIERQLKVNKNVGDAVTKSSRTITRNTQKLKSIENEN